MTREDRHQRILCCRISLLLAAMLFLVAMLQGCTADDAEASAAAAPSRILARGIVDVEGGLVSIRPQRTGQLLDVHAALGQQVSRGETLATLEGAAASAEVDAARADLQRARAELANARSKQRSLVEQMSRVREAVDLGAESGRVRDELQTALDAQTSEVPIAEASIASAEARLRAVMIVAESSAIRAPVAGRIVEVNAHLGDVVSSSEGPAMFLVRPEAALVIRASIAERDASRIRVGSTASITAVDADGPTYDGRVFFVGELARKPDPSFASTEFSGERIVDCVLQVDATAALRVGSVVMVSFR